jgi:hypothetical protein
MASADNASDASSNQRFLDVGNEPLRMTQPIEGYQHLPLVSLEEAVEPIRSFCPDIRHRVYVAKANCE